MFPDGGMSYERIIIIIIVAVITLPTMLDWTLGDPPLITTYIPIISDNNYWNKCYEYETPNNIWISRKQKKVLII